MVKVILISLSFSSVLVACGDASNGVVVQTDSGIHCLSKSDGRHADLEVQVKKILRDPDSFQHIETNIAPVSKGTHTLRITYRAKNGFGGYSEPSTVFAEVNTSTCKAKIFNHRN